MFVPNSISGLDQAPDDRTDFPMGPVGEVDRLAGHGVGRRGGEATVPDPLCSSFGQGQPDSRRQELDIVDGQRGDLFGCVPGRRDQQDPVGVQIEVTGIELLHQPPRQHLFCPRRGDRPPGAFDACP